MNRVIAGILGAAGLAALLTTGCAPRHKGAYFERWSKQDTERRAEMEREEKIRAEVEARMEGKAAPAPAAAPAAPAPVAAPTPPPPPPPPVAEAPPPGEPQTTTATDGTPPIGADGKASRVLAPTEEEEEAIY
jgi:hypothetical protein